ncbi:Sulfate transporter CysZ, partial [Salmonella enterica subsp. enterica serovar Urbana str. R8-2977]
MVSSSTTVPHSGVYYFSQGWKLVTLPGIRRFVILPLLVNIVLMGGAFWWLFTQLDAWIPSLMSHVPDWLQWLSYLLWPIAVISVLLVFGYFFSTLANWIAAPFN